MKRVALLPLFVVGWLLVGLFVIVVHLCEAVGELRNMVKDAWRDYWRDDSGETQA